MDTCNFACLVEQHLRDVLLAVPRIASNLQLRLNFGERTSRLSGKAVELFSRGAAVPFGEITRDRHRGAAKLLRQAV